MDKKLEKMLNENWKILLAAIVAGVIACIGAVTVFVWFIQTSNIGLKGTATIGAWSMAWVIEFIFTLILWELLFVGLPSAIVFGIGGYLWWNHLTPQQKKEFKNKDKKHHDNNGGFNFIMNIAYVIYLLIDGKYNTPFGSLPYSYWIYAYVWTLIWVLILIGIPMSIGGLIYFFYYKNKPKKK